MGRPRKKSEYDSEGEIKRLMTDVVSFFGEPYDDRKSLREPHVSLRVISDHFKITHLKARKILITAGVYSTAISRRVQELSDESKSIKEIMKITGLSQASVHSYLPYLRVIYNMPVSSVDADRKKLQRRRAKECKTYISSMTEMTEQQKEENLWKLIELHKGCIFNKNQKEIFRYHVKDDVIIIDKTEDAILRSSVMAALQNVLELKGKVKNHKMLVVVGSEYIYPIFKRIGVIESYDFCSAINRER